MKQFEFENKIESMLSNLDIDDAVIKECVRLFNCGGVDPEEYGSDYLLPKIILHVALQNITDEFRPLSKEGKETANNLKHF